MKDSSGFSRRSGARGFSIYASIGLPLIAATSAWALPDTDNGASARAEAGGLAEIVVTATRREENVDKVPVSITALSQDAMDQKGIRDFTELVRFTPGVSLDTSGTNAISIRGISSSGGAGTTGIYIDDTPIQMRGIRFRLRGRHGPTIRQVRQRRSRMISRSGPGPLASPPRTGTEWGHRRSGQTTDDVGWRP